LFSTTYESIKQVPCLLSKLADPDSKFKTLDANGALFIDRNPKHFATILDVITNYSTSDYWPLPDDMKEFQELLQEADFYSLPDNIIEILKDKHAELQDDDKTRFERLHRQINELQKEKDSLLSQLTQEIREKSDLRELLNDCQLQTNGCYVSICERPFSLRIARDMSKIQWSLTRGLERLRKGSNMVYSPQKGSDHSHHIAYELKPVNATDASVVLWNNSKTYLMCERRWEANSARIDICCIGNGELLVIFENYPSPDATGEQKERIVCRFQADTR